MKILTRTATKEFVDNGRDPSLRGLDAIQSFCHGKVVVNTTSDHAPGFDDSHTLYTHFDDGSLFVVSFCQARRWSDITWDTATIFYFGYQPNEWQERSDA